MFNSYKNLIGGKFSLVDDNKLFILARWASFNYENAEGCSDWDRVHLACRNKNILKVLLYSKLKSKSIGKFLKAEKEDKELLGYIKKFYGWSGRELSWQLKFINLEDKAFLSLLALKFGWDKKVCKKYEVDFTTPKKEKLKKEVKQKSKSLFDF